MSVRISKVKINIRAEVFMNLLKPGHDTILLIFKSANLCIYYKCCKRL